jgi:hypothetical protein
MSRALDHAGLPSDDGFALLLEDQQAGRLPAGIDALCDAIEDRHGPAVLGIAFYGSCRRKQDASDGLVDLLVVVEDYHSALGSRVSALLNFLLPPNVYYLQTGLGDSTLRCKYAIIRLDQLERRARSRHDHYFWARFCQPLRLARGDAQVHRRLARLRSEAALSFARRIAPLMTDELAPDAFWTLALKTSYRCELRPEPEGAARTLIGHDPGYWRTLSRDLAGQPDSGLAWSGGKLASTRGTSARLAARLSWAGRRISGKVMNLARLFKAAGTFTNGVDYLVWKVERHSGVKVEPTERMRRHPRLAIWGLAWQMWRQGGFR